MRCAGCVWCCYRGAGLAGAMCPLQTAAVLGCHAAALPPCIVSSPTLLSPSGLVPGVVAVCLSTVFSCCAVSRASCAFTLQHSKAWFILGFEHCGCMSVVFACMVYLLDASWGITAEQHMMSSRCCCGGYCPSACCGPHPMCG